MNQIKNKYLTMKLIIILVAFIGLSSAGHHFFAEQNLMCSLCKESLKLIKAEKFETLKMSLEQFPKAQELIENHKDYLQHMVEGKSIQELCDVEYCNDPFVDFEINQDKIIDEINQLHHEGKVSWKAGRNGKFYGAKASEVRKTLGTIVDPDWVEMLPSYHYTKTGSGTPPTNFDSRDQWPQCTNIGEVRDQANCGSCWAFGTTEAFNDRYCILSGKTFLLSTADTAGCCKGVACGFSDSCNGGQIGSPYNFFKDTGIVSGGLKADVPKTCYPYTMDKCNHHESGTF